MTTSPLESGFLLLRRSDFDAAVHGAAGAGRVDPRARHLRLVALHRLPRLQRLRPQPTRHQVRSSLKQVSPCFIQVGSNFKLDLLQGLHLTAKILDQTTAMV